MYVLCVFVIMIDFVGEIVGLYEINPPLFLIILNFFEFDEIVNGGMSMLVSVYFVIALDDCVLYTKLYLINNYLLNSKIEFNYKSPKVQFVVSKCPNFMTKCPNFSI